MQQDYDFENHIIPKEGFAGYIIQNESEIFVSGFPAVRDDGQYRMVANCNGLLYQDGPDEVIPQPIPQDNLVGFLRPKVYIERQIHFDGLVQVAPDDAIGVLYVNDEGRLEVRYARNKKLKVCFYGDKEWESKHVRQ